MNRELKSMTLFLEKVFSSDNQHYRDAAGKLIEIVIAHVTVGVYPCKTTLSYIYTDTKSHNNRDKGDVES